MGGWLIGVLGQSSGWKRSAVDGEILSVGIVVRRRQETFVVGRQDFWLKIVEGIVVRIPLAPKSFRALNSLMQIRIVWHWPADLIFNNTLRRVSVEPLESAPGWDHGQRFGRGIGDVGCLDQRRAVAFFEPDDLQSIRVGNRLGLSMDAFRAGKHRRDPLLHLRLVEHHGAFVQISNPAGSGPKHGYSLGLGSFGLGSFGLGFA